MEGSEGQVTFQFRRRTEFFQLNQQMIQMAVVIDENHTKDKIFPQVQNLNEQDTSL
jgi:hypothetical protein